MNNAKTSATPNGVNLYYFLIFFLLAHSILWTIGPALLRPSLPHDTLEGITWGMQWQLGYSKHPFLTAWLCAGVTQLFHTVGWPVYLLAQVAVTTTFIAAWKLGEEFFYPPYALVAALLLDGVLFFNINSFTLTPDTVQSPLWALLILFFYKALKTKKIGYWILVGFFSALSVCTKYQVLVLFIPMLIFCLINYEARMSFGRKGIYIAFAVFLLFLIPHLYWLYHNQFITLHYAQSISSEYTHEQNLVRHFVNPLYYLLNNFLYIVAVFILSWPFYSSAFKKKSRNIKTELCIQKPLNERQFDSQFIFIIGLGPFITSLILCIITGDHFPIRWSTPYYFMIGIMLLYTLKPTFKGKEINGFLYTLVIFSFSLFLGRMISFSYLPRNNSDAFLPNTEVAQFLEKIWGEQYHHRIPYIAGSSYLVSLVTPYISPHPTPYFNWDKRISPWVNEEELKRNGGIFIWDEGQNYIWDKASSEYTHIPDWVLKRYPQLSNVSHYTFYRLSDKSPVLIGVAFLPPKVNANSNHDHKG